MEKKSFLKSEIFKCIFVLLIITLISGGLLALLNDLLYVSPDERTGRALPKSYGREISANEYDILLDVDSGDKAVEYEFGQIEKIFAIGDQNAEHDLLFKTTGNEGYKGGTVTMWIKVVVNGESKEIDKVIIDSNTKQTLMSKLDAKFTDGFYIDISGNYDTYFTAKNKGEGTKNPVTGATYSAQAGCNAVNCVIEYLKGGN